MELLILFLIAGAVVAVYFLRNSSPMSKGKIGEQEIANRIQKEVKHGLEGFVLQNLYLPKRDGSTSEIDVLLVSSKGLFVIESKNYAGYIFGNDQRKNWTVSLYAGKNWLGIKQTKKFRFYNPVWQNRGHIKSLRNFIGTKYPMFSLVVFSDRSDLMNITYDPGESLILHTSQMRSFFSSVRTQYPDVVSPSDMECLYHCLSPFTQATEVTKQAHIEQVNQPKPAPGFCPLCGGALVLRTARRGPHVGQKFYGCSNFPECRFTWNIEQE